MLLYWLALPISGQKDGDSHVVTKLTDRQRKTLKSLELTPPKAVRTAQLRTEAA